MKKLITSELETYQQYLFPDSKRKRRLNHLFFWMAFVGYHLLLFFTDFEERLKDPVVLSAYIIYYIRFAPIYYLMIELSGLLSRYLTGTVLLFCSFILVVILFHMVNILTFYFFDRYIGLENLPGGFKVGGYYFLDPLSNINGKLWRSLILDITELQLILFPIGLKMTTYGMTLLREQSMREREKLEDQHQKLRAENRMIRAQLSPHFICNVILGASAEIGNVSQKASLYLNQLADMIRFSFHHVRPDMVDLARELEYVKDYIDLQLMFNSRRLKLDFYCPSIAKGLYKVPTLCIITLVENAFKHGLHNSIDICYMSVKGSVVAGFFNFEISNSKPLTPVFTEKHPNGLGIDHIRRLLEIHFGSNFLLEIKELKDCFTVWLRMPLSA